MSKLKLHEWGSPKGLQGGWRGRILKGASKQKRLDRPELREEITSIWLNYDKDVKLFMAGGYTEHPSISEAINKTVALIPNTDRIIKELTSDLLENTNKKVEEAKKQERERIVEELREGAKLIWAFINKERGKDNDDSLLITVRDMIHDMVESQALKSS